jgi:hypothetical protein
MHGTRRIAAILADRDVNEGYAVVEPERSVTEPARITVSKLRHDILDQLLILIGRFRMGLVLHYRYLIHCAFPVFEM